MDKKQKAYTLIQASKANGCSSSEIGQKLTITRAYAHRLIRQLIVDGLVASIGSGPSVRYVSSQENISPSQSYSRLLKRDGLDEDIVYQEVIGQTKLLARDTENVRAIFRYAFTEMLNNAIEHSGSDTVKIEVEEQDKIIRFVISDHGVGIFNNIQQKRGLPGISDAIAEVTKGKVTTQPTRHSGEGIFFTSRVVGSLAIRSSGKEVIFNNRIDDIFLKNSSLHKGTIVVCTIDRATTRDIASVFRSYTNEAYEFNKTEVLVRLFAIGSEQEYISRSQARRILEGLEKFSKIIFDFKGVETVGQGFAHEVFSVWAKNYHDIRIEYSNANENIEFMIRHAQ